MERNLSSIEDAIDHRVADVLELVVQRFQAERDRLLTGLALNGGAIELVPNADFDSLLNKLLEMPIATLRPVLETHTLSPDVKADIEQPSKKPRISSSIYENMELLAVAKVEKPSAIIAMPHRDCFGIKQPKHISFVSPSAEVKENYRLRVTLFDHVRSSTSFCPYAIAVNPLNNQLICIDRGLITSIESIDFHSGVANCRDRIKNEMAVPYGFAISANSSRLYTSFGRSIVGYSLKDWRLEGEWAVGGLAATKSSWSTRSIVLGVRNDDLLFFKDDAASSPLYTVPIDEKGDLKMEEMKIIPQQRGDWCGIAFDEDLNILLAAKRDHVVKVLSPDGSKELATIRAPDSYTASFCPISLAGLTVPKGGEHFYFKEKNIRCSRVLAVANHEAGDVLFFGTTESKN